MKKSIFTYASLILSAATLLSCQKLEEVNEPLVAADTHSVIVTTDATRTVNDDMHTYFEDGDKMTVIYRRSSSSNYHANEYTYSASSGQFTGDASLTDSNEYYWWGIYPYSSSNSKATSVSVSIHASQTQVGNDSKAALAGEGFPLVGKTGSKVKGDTTPKFNVSNVATVLDFKITNGSDTPLTVTKVEFTAPSGIAGSFSADLTASTISWKAESSASKTVTLNIASGEAIANGAAAHFYAGAGPFSGAGSYTIEVTAKDAEGQTFVSTRTINGNLDCKSSTINTISHTFVPGEPVAEKTYTKVTSAPQDWSGTYLIVDETSKNIFAYDQTGFKKGVTIESNKITSKDLEKYEVTISATASDNTHYYVKTSNGKYLYRSSSDSNDFLNDSETYSSNKYYAKIGEDDMVSLVTKRSRGTEYYFRYSSSAFAFSTSSATIQLYKLDGESNPDTPDTPAQSSLNIENKQLAAYLDAVEKQPYFSNNTFGSYSSYYTSSLMSSNKYYSGSSSSNRLDQPAPVVIIWSGNATKIEVFTSSSKTSASRVASESFSSSSSASIYNLIPGQKYYYTATNVTTTVATGDFTPEGRRRMIRVSSSFDDSHAANCRDFGGLPTVDGKHVKYGLIYRGSNIDGLSKDSNAKDVFLNTMKIKWDIDLRASSEKGSAPTFDGVSKGTQSYSASFDDSNLRSKTKVRSTLKEIIDAINKDTPEPVYIHCRIGSDRTGYICLLVEALIGVTQNYCDTDYEITSFTGSVTGTRFRVDNTMVGGMYKSGIKYFEDFSGTTLHDKVYNFVTSSDGLNISKDDVDKFISRMKE